MKQTLKILGLIIVPSCIFADPDCSEINIVEDVTGEYALVCEGIEIENKLSESISNVNTALDNALRKDDSNFELWNIYKNELNDYIDIRKHAIAAECSVLNRMPYNYGSGQGMSILSCENDGKKVLIDFLNDIKGMAERTYK
ncbi:MAG: hypothetical protein P8X74_22735 [Reinekea sp.]